MVRTRRGHVITGHGSDCTQWLKQSGGMMKRLPQARLLEWKQNERTDLTRFKDFVLTRKRKNCKLVYECLKGELFNVRETESEARILNA